MKRTLLSGLLLSFAVSSMPMSLEAAPKKKKSGTKTSAVTKKAKKKKAKKSSSGADYTPTNFLPFGVGQFMQGKTLMGAGFAGGQVLMLYVYMDRNTQIAASNSDAKKTIQDLENNPDADADQIAGWNDYLKKNSDYVKQAESHANLALLGFVGLWGLGVVDAVWDPLGTRAKTSKARAEIDNAEDDSAEKWAAEKRLETIQSEGKLGLMAEPRTFAQGSVFGLSWNKPLN